MHQMMKQRVLLAAVAAFVVAAFALGGVTEAARGGGKSAALSYAWSGGAHWVTYSIDVSSGTLGDVAVFHTCYDAAGGVVYSGHRRFYFGDGPRRHGTADMWVDGATCTAFADFTMSGSVVTSTAAITNTVSYSTAGMY